MSDKLEVAVDLHKMFFKPTFWGCSSLVHSPVLVIWTRTPANLEGIISILLTIIVRVPVSAWDVDVVPFIPAEAEDVGAIAAPVRTSMLSLSRANPVDSFHFPKEPQSPSLVVWTCRELRPVGACLQGYVPASLALDHSGSLDPGYPAQRLLPVICQRETTFDSQLGCV